MNDIRQRLLAVLALRKQHGNWFRFRPCFNSCDAYCISYHNQSATCMHHCRPHQKFRHEEEA